MNMVDLDTLVKTIERDVNKNHQGAIGLWGLEKAMEMFIGKRVLDMVNTANKKSKRFKRRSIQ